MSNALDRVQQAATNVAFMDHYHPEDDTGNVSVRKRDLALLIALADACVYMDIGNYHNADGTITLNPVGNALAALTQETP